MIIHQLLSQLRIPQTQAITLTQYLDISLRYLHHNDNSITNGGDSGDTYSYCALRTQWVSVQQSIDADIKV